MQDFVNSIGGIDMDYVLKQDPGAARKSIQPAKMLFMLKSFMGFSASTREDYAAQVQEVLSNEGEKLLPKLVGQGEDVGSIADTMALNRYALVRKRHYKFTTPGARDDLDSPGGGPVKGDTRSYIENLQMMKDMFEKGEVPDNHEDHGGLHEGPARLHHRGRGHGQGHPQARRHLPHGGQRPHGAVEPHEEGHGRRGALQGLRLPDRLRSPGGQGRSQGHPRPQDAHQRVHPQALPCPAAHHARPLLRGPRRVDDSHPSPARNRPSPRAIFCPIT